MDIPEKFLKPYNPTETEARIYKTWEESGFFNPDVCIEKGVIGADSKPYTIMMPPPNVTGVLHMGHAMMLTLQDIMIRYKRMQGFRTLWLPGTDHAAIATQSKVEKEISKKEGKSRHDLGREELLNRVRTFAQESHDTIVSQVKVMGASCDWSREAFTLDDTRNLAVNTMFKKMYDDGLIYRGHRIVNWDPKGQTTIADDEIVYESRKAKLYTFKYSKDFPIAISTTRPETKVGDTAVAVHPSDERYKALIGKEYDVDFFGTKLHIKIIGDEGIDKDFGTGALGVTPAHSPIDWDMAQKNDLPIVAVINEYGKMSAGGEAIVGKKVAEAREIIVAWLKEQNLLIDEKEIDQNVPTAERTSGIIEPLPKLQWFVNVNKPIPHHGNKTLKDLMRGPVADGDIKIIPDYFNKTYFHWIDNLRDWCISRQIWYGHRIPVWYRPKADQPGADPEIFVGVTPPEGAEKSQGSASADEKTNNQVHSEGTLQGDFSVPSGDTWTQDEDTLDTWFSSALWTFSTLGWPEKTKDLELYHPTDVLETGYEILFFWVARMILMTGYALDTIPFHTVYLHGTVRDGQGRKMSKSLGNGIDPLDIAAKYGADAGRMALIAGTAAGTDSKISEDKIKGYKHFANKLWNITRFVLGYTPSPSADSTSPLKGEEKIPELTAQDKELVAECDALMQEVTNELEKYAFHLAIEKLYHYIWSRFADILLEESKEVFKNGNEIETKSRAWTLMYILKNSLKALHPFMPFVTEEIWNTIPGNTTLLMVEKWPVR
jgi:valyl-tRNA synthetase